MIKKLLFLILCLCLIFPVVSALTDYTGSLTKTFAGLQYTSSNSAANEVSTKYNCWTYKWTTDLNIVGRPASVAVYTVADQKIQQTAIPFTLSDGTGAVYATGTVNIGNGTSYYGGTASYYVFNFATYDTGARSGIIIGNLTLPVGTDYIPSGVPLLPDATNPMGFSRSGTSGTPGGYIYTGYDDSVSITYNIRQVSGIGGTTLANIDVTKNSANTLTSNVRVYKKPDTLLGQAPITSKTGTDYLAVVGQDYSVGFYIPAKTKIYNSTEYYYPIIGGTDVFNLTVSPVTSKINTALTATLSVDNSSGFDVIRAIDYHAFDATGTKVDFFESGSSSNHLNYVKRLGIWYGWNSNSGDFTNVKGVTFPETVSISFTHTGNYSVAAYVYSGASSEYLYEAIYPTRIQITDTDNAQKYNLLLQTTDATNNQFLSSPTYGVKNLVSNTWQNVTGNAIDSSYNFPLNSGTPVGVWITKTGYTPANFTTIVNGNNIITTPLTPTALPILASNLTYTNLLVNLKFTNDGVQYYPLDNARISVETLDPAEPIKKQIAYTNSAGVAYFRALNQTHNHTQTYASVITSVIPNYKTVSKSIIPTGNLVTTDLWTQANQIIIPTNQPTLIPTTSPTVNPTVTGIGGTVKNNTAAVCGAPTGTTNIVDIFKANIACWGVSDRFSQDLAFAALIILFCAFLLSKYGKGLGAIVGGAIGFVIALAANLIPLWVFFALVVIAGLIFGLKLYGADK